MTYADSRGRRRVLTREQVTYLRVAHRGYDRGWGGLKSTLTARLLRERGLITLDDMLHRDRGWRVTGRTPLGDDVLDKWDALEWWSGHS